MHTETLHLLLFIYIAAALITLLVSTVTGNHSQVDKLWSIMPPVYAWIIAVKSDMEPRLVLMASLVTIWGLRLTFNFWRRGGYSIRIWDGGEDYRWPVLQAKPVFQAKWRWMLFNLFFISYYQMGLILLFTLPALKSMHGRPLSGYDWLLAALMTGFVIVETVADQQQWNFHRRKREMAAVGGELPEKYRKGFAHTGLWGIVRHPNYTAEQAIWIVFYFFSVSATGRWLNWTVSGAILLVLLFAGSSSFSESISAGKYPGYAEYRKRVPRFLPGIRIPR